MPTKQTSTKRVLFNSGLYSVSLIMQKAIGFFLLPLYTSFLTPADYGITGVVVSLTSVLSTLFTLALDASATRFYYDYKDDEEKLRNFWGMIIVFVICNSFVLGLIIVLLQNILLTPFIKGVEFYPFIFIGVLTIVITPVYSIYKAILQTKQQASRFAINTTAYFIVLICLNIFLIVFLHLGAAGLLLSSLITGWLFTLFAVYELVHKKLIAFHFNSGYLKEALKYSLPILPHSMSGVIADFVSKLFMNNQVSTASLGLVNLGFQFLNIIQTLQLSANNAYVPWSFDVMTRGKEEYPRLIRFADLVLRGTCIASLAMALFIKEVVQIMTNPTYTMAWTMVPIMVVACQIAGIYYFHVNALFYNKIATRYIFIATLTGNFISVLLSVLLTDKIGLMTPAIVLVIEKSITTTIVVLMSKKLEPIDFDLKKMVLYIGILIGASFVGLIFNIQDPTGPITLFCLLYKAVILAAVSFFLMRKDFGVIKDTARQILNHLRGR